MYKLDTSSKVDKFIAKRTSKERTAILKVFRQLCTDPYHNTLDIKPYKGTKENDYRLRIRDYRFIYRVIDDEVLIYVYKGDNRGDIYK